ncbi:MAG TPA: pantoate--beta-alanine ligase, partial [Phycisphaerales bacterium]|nr:pantoate--beta-alanine ligase [Phycisphaerales bacterium]
HLNETLASRPQAPVLVPTMGALHAGHLALISRARDIAGRGGGRGVVVSIFVNPTQFAPNEDFARYPRQLEEDTAICEQAGADVIFAPSVEEMYPAGKARVADGFAMPSLPEVATRPKLEDASRPTHFIGVVKVVGRLFDIVQPAQAVFGEKDYQQLRVITDMVREQQPRWRDLQVIPHATVRERDGLAMSSRNAYLTSEQRKTALTLWRALSEAKQERTPAAAEDVMRVLLEEAGFEIDYAAVRDAQTLMPVVRFDRPCRALIAARIGGAEGVGGTRLIDNMAVEHSR